jgi:hypothetical protein
VAVFYLPYNDANRKNGRGSEISRTQKEIAMKHLVAVLLLVASGNIISQAPQSRAPSANRKPQQSTAINELLAKPMDWHEHKARMFDDSRVSMVFTLTTSWIPGPDHKGMFRYKMSAAPDIPTTLNERAKFPEFYGYEGIEHFIQRVNRCVISLDLYDPDGFLLRKVPIDAGAHIVALSANDAIRMDVEEYKKLTWDPKGSGTYTIEWSCPQSSP